MENKLYAAGSMTIADDIYYTQNFDQGASTEVDRHFGHLAEDENSRSLSGCKDGNQIHLTQKGIHW